MERAARNCVIGVDAGTGSVRAGVFDLRGTLLGSADCPIQVFRPRPDYVEQSSRDIWQAAGAAVREALAKSGVDRSSVLGIAYDATCSLVALGEGDEPVTVSPDEDPEHNIIVWMDHRATNEADRINATGHPVLRYVGGKLSPEQQPPKLKWLKEHLPSTWKRTRRFMDLADYLAYESCKVDVRSLCTVVCKWTYLGHEGEGGSWDMSFFRQIELEDLFEGGRAGTVVAPVGSRAGLLTPEAAAHLGLDQSTVVGVGIIDAHAGGIGSLGMHAGEAEDELAQMNQTLALIGGTSSCHMAVSGEPRFIPGVWGPYFGAMIPGMWLNEGGQSATGALIDHVIVDHATHPELLRAAEQSGRSTYEILNDEVEELRGETAGQEPTADLHVLPYHHGNRSPRADSRARGMVSGLTLDTSLRSLALLYYATIQAIAYGTRHIIEEMNRHGYAIRRIHACGGGTKNPLWLQEHADIAACDLYVARDTEAVLLGSAILAAVASGAYPSVLEAMRAMSPRAEVIRPNAARRTFHEAKYRVFKRMYEHQQEYRQIMGRNGDAR
jgi:FGGY-family pentulose kinase